jgi:hypothetical protein
VSTLFQAGEATRAELVQLQMEQVSVLEAEVAEAADGVEAGAEAEAALEAAVAAANGAAADVAAEAEVGWASHAAAPPRATPYLSSPAPRHPTQHACG